MASRPVTIPNQFATQSGNVPAAQLDSDFNALRDIVNDSGTGWSNFATDTGSANTYAVALTPPAVAYTAGMLVSFTAANSNTGPSTINVNSLGAQTIQRADGTALTGNEIRAGTTSTLIYSGSVFLLPGASLLSTVSFAGLQQGVYAGARFSDDFGPGTNWTTILAGAAWASTAANVNSSSKAFGEWSLACPGSGTNGQVFSPYFMFPGLGACEIDIRMFISPLPTVPQQFYALMGIGDTVNNAIYIGTYPIASQTNWVGYCQNSGSVSTTNGVAMTAAYHKFQIKINAAWTSVTFFVDGAQIGSAITTNIPAIAICPAAVIVKSAGASAAALYVDSYYLDYQYPR